jgi:hypothetical protein
MKKFVFIVLIMLTFSATYAAVYQYNDTDPFDVKAEYEKLIQGEESQIKSGDTIIFEDGRRFTFQTSEEDPSVIAAKECANKLNAYLFGGERHKEL